MGIQVDPVGYINIRYAIRPNISVPQRNRISRCLFGKSDPEQNRRIYENAMNSERNRCIQRYGFDPIKSEFVDVGNVNNVDNVKIDDNKQQMCLDNVLVKQNDGADIVKIVNDNSSPATSDNDECNVIKYKLSVKRHLQASRSLRDRPYERQLKITDYFTKTKNPSS